MNNPRLSPYTYVQALNDQKYAKRKQVSDIPYEHVLKQNFMNQKQTIEYSPYDISLQKSHVKIEAPATIQRSVSVFNTTHYLQDTCDKTQRTIILNSILNQKKDQDIDSSINGVIKYLDNQKCFDYSKQVKNLLRELKKLQEENSQLKKRQYEVISLLSQSSNKYQSPKSPDKQTSQSQVNQPVLSSAKNFVDDFEESVKKNYNNQDPLRKNLFETFDSITQISPIQPSKQSQLKSPESNFSNPFSQSSIDEDINNENINYINIQLPQNQQITQNNSIQEKQVSKNKQVKSQQPQHQKNQIQNNNNNKQNNKPKKIIQIELKDKHIQLQQQPNKKISSIITQQFITTTENNQSSDFARQTASFQERPIILQQQNMQPSIRTCLYDSKKMTKQNKGMKDSLKLYKQSQCKSTSPQRQRNKSNGCKSQPRKVIHQNFM